MVLSSKIEIMKYVINFSRENNIAVNVDFLSPEISNHEYIKLWAFYYAKVMYNLGYPNNNAATESLSMLANIVKMPFSATTDCFKLANINDIINYSEADIIPILKFSGTFYSVNESERIIKTDFPYRLTEQQVVYSVIGLLQYVINKCLNSESDLNILFYTVCSMVLLYKSTNTNIYSIITFPQTAYLQALNIHASNNNASNKNQNTQNPLEVFALKIFENAESCSNQFIDKSTTSNNNIYNNVLSEFCIVLLHIVDRYAFIHLNTTDRTSMMDFLTEFFIFITMLYEYGEIDEGLSENIKKSHSDNFIKKYNDRMYIYSKHNSIFSDNKSPSANIAWEFGKQLCNSLGYSSDFIVIQTAGLLLSQALNQINIGDELITVKNFIDYSNSSSVLNYENNIDSTGHTDIFQANQYDLNSSIDIVNNVESNNDKEFNRPEYEYQVVEKGNYHTESTTSNPTDIKPINNWLIFIGFIFLLFTIVTLGKLDNTYISPPQSYTDEPLSASVSNEINIYGKLAQLNKIGDIYYPVIIEEGYNDLLHNSNDVNLFGFVEINNLNLREDHTVSAPVITTLNQKDIFFVFGEYNDWYFGSLLRDDTNYPGWVTKYYVSLMKYNHETNTTDIIKDSNYYKDIHNENTANNNLPPSSDKSSNNVINTQNLESTINYITIGTSEIQVKNIMGTPSSIISNAWGYGLSSVYFNSGKVTGWSNIGNNLKIYMGSIDSSAPPITIGSSHNDVIKAMGTPSSIISNTWGYKLSSIYFNNGKITGWSNISNNLRIYMGTIDSSAPPITIGSSHNDVIKAMGTPSSIIGSTWGYELSSIYFNNGKVTGWSNISNNLKL